VSGSLAIPALAPPRRRRRLGYEGRIGLWGFGFVLPSLLFMAVFKYGPMAWSIGLSFTDFDMASTPHWVGFDNYTQVFSDPIFRETLWNTMIYIAGSTVLLTVVGLGLAMLMNLGIPGSRHCMTVIFLANLMPIIAVCLVWRFLLHPFGLVNQLLAPLGFGRIDWLTDSGTAMPVIVFVTVWRFAPYFMIVFLAALLALPRDYYEAAELDGAGPLRRFWHITLPLLAPTIFFVVVVSALLSARLFLMPYIITGGGPGNSTRVLSMLIYETGFSYMKMGQAAAISVILFAIMLVFTTGQMRFFQSRERVLS
jgi:ABC-type sugar transport system permease subunit